jgi:predicted nucleic acid-binding protein
MDSPNLYILDANLLIDLDYGGVLEALFALPGLFAATDFVINELGTVDVNPLIQLGLQRVSFDVAQVMEVVALRETYGGLSVADGSALVLARSRQAMLLTGDGALRRAAEDVGVSVHGTLWLLDELLVADLITFSAACRALSAMLASGARLPEDDCDGRRKAWKCSG